MNFKEMLQNKKVKIGLGIGAAAGVLLVGGHLVTANNAAKERSAQVVSSGQLLEQSLMSEAAVKQIVEKETGLTNLTYEKIVLKAEGNRRVYEVDAYLNGKEYDFDIDAMSGEVLYSNQAGNNNDVTSATLIDEARVKQIVSERTGETTLNYVRVEVTQDEDYNGAKIYEVDVYSQTHDYDFDIHAITGDVLKYEKETVTRPNQGNASGNNGVAVAPAPSQPAPSAPVAPAAPAQQPAAPQPAPQTPPVAPAQNAASIISEARVREIVAGATGTSGLTYRKLYLTKEDDYGYRAIYDVEAYAGNMEYDLDIDAVTGAVLSFDSDNVND